MQQYLEFIKEIDKLKNVKRKTLNFNSDTEENSGEHSWHLALSVLVMSKYSNEKVDIEKCLKMALIHDLVEIDAGDNIVYAEDPDKFDRELKAAKRIFGLLPKELGDELLDIWIEFEKKETAESKYVSSLDRFLPLYSNIIQGGHSWKTHNISKERVYNRCESEISEGSRELWNESDRMLKAFFDSL